MSADVLREAARLMRERGNNATLGPWVQQSEPRSAKVRSAGIDAENFDDEIAVTIDAIDAEHIASWHPAVALAVADWLEAEAGTEERLSALAHRDSVGSIRDEAIAVARAYLGSDK